VRLDGKFRVAGLGMKQIGSCTLSSKLVEACLMDLEKPERANRLFASISLIRLHMFASYLR
jgi:hypothetical protein